MLENASWESAIAVCYCRALCETHVHKPDPYHKLSIEPHTAGGMPFELLGGFMPKVPKLS